MRKTYKEKPPPPTTLLNTGRKVKAEPKNAVIFPGEMWYNGKNGMPQRKHGKVEPQKTIGVSATDIFVARNRSAEPYIKSFIAAPENLAQESLGTIVGVFSVSDRSESSAYVVNALASVAKKEYFANPRRGSLESFEATLHKMNVTLAELVKNGQADWIGNLHGAIAVFERHTLHFSVTGEGAILLFRGGALSDIGEGLASEEAKSHPIKTFVEISSGRLAAGDYILLSSPELFALFEPGELERSARRIGMGKKFSQFLETAMVNELKTGAVVILDVFEKLVESAPAQKSARRHAEKPRVINAWSAQAFEERKNEDSSYFREEIPGEAIPVEPPAPTDDARFGEIYVRGEASGKHDEHPTITRCRWILEDILSRYEAAKMRAKERMRQQGEALSSSVSGSVSSSLAKIREGASSLRKPADSAPLPPAEEETPPEDAAPVKIRFRIPEIPRVTLPKISVPDLPKVDASRYAEISKRHAGRLGGSITRSVKIAYFDFLLPMLRGLGSSIRYSTTLLRRRFFALPPKRQLLVASGMTFVLTIGIILIWNMNTEEKSESVPIVVTELPEPAFPPDGEKNAVLASPETVPGTPEEMIAPVFLNGRLFLVAEQTIVDTGDGTSYRSPSDSPVRYATGMDDLNLIFLSLENGELYSFAPANRSFVKNAVPLPAGFRTAGIGSFLTYLYFLEEQTGTIYRYPRAEGGFGEGLLWTREAMPTGTAAIAVSETIYASAGSSVSAFLQGRPSTGFSLEMPSTPFSVTALCANPDTPGIVGAIDAPAKRIVIFSDSGTIVRQYFSESFADAAACSLKDDGSSVAVSAGRETLLLPLMNNGQ